MLCIVQYIVFIYGYQRCHLYLVCYIHFYMQNHSSVARIIWYKIEITPLISGRRKSQTRSEKMKKAKHRRSQRKKQSLVFFVAVLRISRCFLSLSLSLLLHFALIYRSGSRRSTHALFFIIASFILFSITVCLTSRVCVIRKVHELHSRVCVCVIWKAHRLGEIVWIGNAPIEMNY